MILIAASWIYILLTIIPFGIFAARLFSIKITGFPELALLGVFLITILASIWAFFARINIEFHYFLIAASLYFSVRFRAHATSVYLGLFRRLCGFPLSLKVLFWLNAAIIIAQSAAAPFLLDNESYYIQTIKWINEYGFVKGLANLHIFLGQSSGWHISQSVYSFSFLPYDFNDLSGLCLLLGNLYAFYRLHDYCHTRETNLLVVGLLPLANFFFLRFSSAPSPDLPLYIITFIVVDQFVQSFPKPDKQVFNFIVAMILFILYIKPSSFVLVLLPVFLLFIGGLRLIGLRIAILATACLLIFVSKNYIISGYPFFPLSFNPWGEVHFSVPNEIIDFYYIQTKIYGFELTEVAYNASTPWQLLKTWLMLPGLHGHFNRLAIVLILIVPFLIYKFNNLKAFWLLNLCMALQVALLLFMTPQYRYFLNFILIFTLFAITCIKYFRNALIVMLSMSCVLAAIFLLVPMRLDAVSANKNANQTLAFTAQNILFPSPNSRMNYRFEKVTNRNLIFNSPVENDFIWGTGAGALPCVNKKQLDYFEKYLGIVPQLQGKSLSQGFYSKTKIKNESFE